MSDKSSRAKFLAATAVLTLGLSGIGATAIFATSANAAPAALADTDGDTLPDIWETQGYDANGDGVIDVDLPAMGADPNHKDLFVEMDYMAGRLPSSTVAFDRIVDVFASSPISNPDGVSGIKLHLDAGVAGGGTYNLGGGNQVPYDSNLSPVLSQTNAIKSANFDSKRAAVFYYMLWADDYDSSCSSGNAFAIPNDTFVVTMGPRCGWTVTQDMQVGTFVHEFGHTLGFTHGGNDSVNYKPNYLSVMNYTFQFGGVPKADGTSYFGYSSVNPGSLNENSLNESNGLGASASAWKTTWFCPDKTARTTAVNASQPIDWNCNGSLTSGVSSDINKSGGKSTLGSSNNWASIQFGGGSVGGSGSLAESRTPSSVEHTEHELTKSDWDNLKVGVLPGH
ncbi:hypothetical protein [Psychromicrobium sp. YIM B11713]|uniref:hypothetical protein n=1 Tax=Psychromicrobium sp. YIM B11713 TaxID=3145233 RepID=UPI00374ECE93